MMTNAEAIADLESIKATGMESIEYAIEVLKTGASPWIPIKTRPLTDEEYEQYGEYMEYAFDCALPDDGAKILITTSDRSIDSTVFWIDEYGLHFGGYEGEAVAWMPFPEPYNRMIDIL